jgi:hypothetical protein
MQKKLEHKASNKIILKGGTVQIFGTPQKKKNQNSMHKEIKSILKSGMFAVLRYRIFCLPFFCPKI